MNTLTITYFGITKHLIDVSFTNHKAERRATIDRKEFEDYIERQNLNDTSFTYTCVETVIALPCTVQIENYWSEMDDTHIHSHLKDFILTNSLHYDEVLAKNQLTAPAAVDYGHSSEIAMDEREQSMTEEDYQMIHVYDSIPR